MDTNEISYSFSAKLWHSEWYFVSLPEDTSNEIRAFFKSFEEGWGRLKVTAKVGNTEWKTAIWFDTKSGTYLLPIKADIRKKEKLQIDQSLDITLCPAI